MTKEEMLKELILSKYKSILEFANCSDMPYTTIISIFKRGIENSSVTNITKICKALGITLDGLSRGKIIPVDPEKAKENKDIRELLSLARCNSEKITEYILDGQQLSKNEAETLLDGIETTLWIIKNQRNREQ